MTSGQSFTKTWRVQNNGSCAWAPGFKFSLVSGEGMGGQTLTLSQPVAAGATTELSVPMTVPAGKTGTIRGDWKMSDAAGAFFGEQVYVQIVVGGAAPTSSTPAGPTATTGATGATATATEEP
jgi:predicted carbohydrate-binding protein with CBM5 and CBM33 domain